jgi:hypothetical protein
LRLDGAAFTSGVEFTFPANSSLSPGEYLLLTKLASKDNYASFRQHYGLASTVKVFGPISGNLSNSGETITLKTAANGPVIFSFAFSGGTSWPEAADGAGHSLVFTGSSNSLALLNHGPAWRSSAYIGGSPGREDPSLPPVVLLNEIASNTVYNDPSRPDYLSNDWIELINLSAQAVSLKDYYLSDSPSELAEYALPNISLAPGERIALDEVSNFHTPLTSGFGLSRFGEKVFLSCLPGNSQDRVVDAVDFKAQPADLAWARIPDGNGFWALAIPTRAQPNRQQPPEVYISEVMYAPSQPAGDLGDFSWREFVEIYNPQSSPISLQNNFGKWRLSGGIDFSFTNITLAAKTAALVVKFDPSNAADLARFRDFYQLTPSTMVIGPYSGGLDNDADGILLEKPYEPELPGDGPSWIVIDSVFYSAAAPWLEARDGNSLQRVASEPGDNPRNWNSATASPGKVASTAAPLKLFVSRSDGVITISFAVEAFHGYQVQTKETLDDANWRTIQTLDPPPVPSSAKIRINITGQPAAFYRVITQ